MALTSNNILPKPEAPQAANIAPGSPLAIIGLFVELIRKRFSAENGLTWVYDRDIKKTTIAIESAFVEQTEHRDFRPAIFVDKDDSTIGRTALGDRAGYNVSKNLEGFWALMSIPILIECVAGKRGESSIIADVVQFYLHASSDLIQSKFGLHEMTPPIAQRTTPFERDDTQWVTPVTFQIQFPVRWSTIQVAPILQEIEATIKSSGVESATEFFEKIVLNGSD